MATILVVDDSPTQQANLVRIIEKNGHTAITADNGIIGVEKAQSEQPDLIFMDVVMPELNGFQATRKITRNDSTSHIPVVIVTTKGQETDKLWGKRQGAVDYIVKPAEEKELMEKINTLL